MNSLTNLLTSKRLLLAASLSAFCCACASADTVFSNENLSPILTGPNVFTTATGGHAGFAAEFTPTADFLLTEASAPLSISQTAIIEASIYSGNPLDPTPDSLLASFAPTTITNQARFFDFSDPSASVALIAGQRYWLVLSFSPTAPAYYTTALWEGGGTTNQPIAMLNFGFEAVGDATNPQFAIDGTPVPEPMYTGLLGLGLLFAGLFLHKRLAKA
jgi:hypothetical protein